MKSWVLIRYISPLAMAAGRIIYRSHLTSPTGVIDLFLHNTICGHALLPRGFLCLAKRDFDSASMNSETASEKSCHVIVCSPFCAIVFVAKDTSCTTHRCENHSLFISSTNACESSDLLLFSSLRTASGHILDGSITSAEFIFWTKPNVDAYRFGIDFGH